MSGFDATNYFVAWLGYQMMALAILFIATRQEIPYRMLWWGFVLFFEVRGWIPGLILLQHFFPKLHPLVETFRFLGAWIGLLFGGIFCSSINSVLQYVKRKREDAVSTLQAHSEVGRDFQTMTVRSKWLADKTGERAQAMLKPNHDPA